MISEEDKDIYNKVITIIKDKVVAREGINIGKLKPTGVVQRVKQKTSLGL